MRVGIAAWQRISPVDSTGQRNSLMESFSRRTEV